MFVPLHLENEQKALMDNQSEEMRRKLVTSCVNAFLVLSQNRAAVKKTDVSRLIMTNTGSSYSYRYVNAIIKEANIELNKMFGMRLFELDDKSKYLLVNSRADYSSYNKHTPESSEEFKVLYFMLMEIFASPDEKVSEADMASLLSAIDIDKSQLKKHTDALMKRYYISLVSDPMIQDSKFYVWGPRAQAEVDPGNFFKSFLDLTEDGLEKDWPEQKRRVEKLINMPNR